MATPTQPAKGKASHKNDKRVDVIFGKTKVKEVERPLITRIFKKTAVIYGLKEATPPQMKTTKITPKSGKTKYFFGSKNAGSMRVPDPSRKDGKGNIAYNSIPVPSNATVDDMIKFVTKVMTANNPSHFISPRGRTYMVGSPEANK